MNNTNTTIIFNDDETDEFYMLCENRGASMSDVDGGHHMDTSYDFQPHEVPSFSGDGWFEHISALDTPINQDTHGIDQLLGLEADLPIGPFSQGSQFSPPSDDGCIPSSEFDQSAQQSSSSSVESEGADINVDHDNPPQTLSMDESLVSASSRDLLQTLDQIKNLFQELIPTTGFLGIRQLLRQKLQGSSRSTDSTQYSDLNQTLSVGSGSAVPHDLLASHSTTLFPHGIPDAALTPGGQE